MAAQDVSTLATQCRIAAVDERLEETLAVLGGIEQFDGEEDGAVIETIVRIGRVTRAKILEAQATLKDLDSEARHVAG